MIRQESTRQGPFRAAPCATRLSQILVLPLQERQSKLRHNVKNPELHIGKMLIDACIKGHKCSVPKRLTLPRDCHHYALLPNKGKVAFFPREFRDKFVRLSDDPFVHFTTGEPGNCAALPVGWIRALWCRAVADCGDFSQPHHPPMLRPWPAITCPHPFMKYTPRPLLFR
jgi:hypothetical protein